MSLHLDRCRLFSTGALSTAFLLLSAGPSGDLLRFSPAEKAELKKNFTAKYDMALEELSILVDGEDVGEMLGTPEVDLVMNYSVSMADTYLESNGNRPTKLSRRFDSGAYTMEISASMAGESQDDSQDSTSGMVGHEVIFTWNPETESYDLAFAEEDTGGEELLKNLTEETDMRSVLPQEEVSVDDTWEFNLGELLLQCTAPGGDLKFEFEGAEDMGEMEAVMEPMMERAMDLGRELMAGSGQATYKGMVEQDGARYGSIDLEFKIDNTVDIASMLTEIIEQVLAEQEEVPEDVSFDIETATIGVRLEGKGNLLWNPTTGLPYTCEIAGDGGFTMELAASVSAMGESQSFSVSLSFEGSLEQALTTE
jgi:hypothetical protein